MKNRNTTSEELIELNCNLDDMIPEQADRLLELLIEEGARDVFYTPIQMKKGRPALKLTLLCEPVQLTLMERILFHHSTSFGFRWHPVTQERLERSFVEVETPFGPVRIKQGFYHGELCQASPEYEDCLRAAKEHDRPLKEVYQAAMIAHQEGRSTT